MSWGKLSREFRYLLYECQHTFDLVYEQHRRAAVSAVALDPQSDELSIEV